MRWVITSKADVRCRLLADRHYTRQTIGHPMWTRPGWVQVLYLEQRNGRSAAWCWWRPKWESGITGTERKDGYRAIECTLFRNETRFRSSDLIVKAVEMLVHWEHAWDVAIPDGLITGVSTAKTAQGRDPNHEPGHCYRMAGWVPFAHPGKAVRADVWLKHPTWRTFYVGK